LLNSQLISAIFISGIVFTIITVLMFAGKFESVELLTYDWLVRLHPKDESAVHPICIVAITEEDIRRLGNWPLTDKKLAETIHIIEESRPRVVGIDLFRDVAVPPGAQMLEATFLNHENIIGVMKFGEGGVPPPVVFQKENRFGFNDIVVDQGGTVRRGLLFLDDGQSVFYSFALQVALCYLKSDGIYPEPAPVNPSFLRLGPTTITPFESESGCYVGADSRGYQFLLDFRKYPCRFETVSLSVLLSGEFDDAKIAGKIVLIGVSAQSVKDIFYTPLSRGSQPLQHVAGVTLHAYIINQLLKFAKGTDSPITTLNRYQELLWVYLWSLIGAGIGLGLRSPWRLAGVAGLLLFGLFLLVYCSLANSLWIPSVTPAFSFVITSTMVTAYTSNIEKKKRTTLMKLFSRHVSNEVAETIWQLRDQFTNGGRPRSQKLFVTVLFSDLKGYTPVAEKLDTQSLIDWLNTYMEAMVQQIINHGGVVDDYAGDGIKANFGFPVPRNTEEEIGRDAVNAVRCALAMSAEIERLHKAWREQNLPQVGIRVGIYTGPAVAGALGGVRRLKYTTVGDTVNIAARLESYDKEYDKESHCRILISDTTYRYLGDQFEVKKIGEEALKGKVQKVPVYQVLGASVRK